MIKKILSYFAFPAGYGSSRLKADLVAGLTVALVLIPQSMAYAELAGLPSYYGLYASFLPPMVAALFGSSRQLATGPVAVVSLLTATTSGGKWFFQCRCSYYCDISASQTVRYPSRKGSPSLRIDLPRFYNRRPLHPLANAIYGGIGLCNYVRVEARVTKAPECARGSCRYHYSLLEHRVLAQRCGGY